MGYSWESSSSSFNRREKYRSIITVSIKKQKREISGKNSRILMLMLFSPGELMTRHLERDGKRNMHMWSSEGCCLGEDATMVLI